MNGADINCGIVQYGVAARAFEEAQDCGDHYLVAPIPNGMLVAVTDGLGHGLQASLAAQAATATLLRYAGAPIPELVARSHEALKHTRGAALSMAYLRADAEELEWTGIGNVEGVVLRAGAGGQVVREHLLLLGGVVGYRLPPLRIRKLAVSPGDMLIFVTDGVSGSFHMNALRSESPTQLASKILAGHGKKTDDALVLVVRYLGLP